MCLLLLLVLQSCAYYLSERWMERCDLVLWKANSCLGGFLPPFPLFQAIVDSVLIIRKPNEPIDLHMVEIMEMKHKSETDTT